jgi:hypothetical protein
MGTKNCVSAQRKCGMVSYCTIVWAIFESKPQLGVAWSREGMAMAPEWGFLSALSSGFLPLVVALDEPAVSEKYRQLHALIDSLTPERMEALWTFFVWWAGPLGGPPDIGR